jgi:hypothetical protein
MTRRFFALLAVIALGLTVVAAPAVAQTENNTNATAAETPGRQASLQLSPTTTLEQWEFRNGTMILTIRAKVPTRATVTDAGALSVELSEGSGSAAGTVRMETYNIDRGTTTIRFAAREVDGAAAVTIATVQSDGLAYIRTDSIGSGRPAIKWGTAALLIISAAAVGAVATFRTVRRRLEREKMEIDRIL